MGRGDELQEHSMPGSVPALPFGTDDRVLPSVHASCFWLELPNGVGLEMEYGYCECPALEIWGAAAGQSQRTIISQDTQWYKSRLSIRAHATQPAPHLIFSFQIALNHN